MDSQPPAPPMVNAAPTPRRGLTRTMFGIVAVVIVLVLLLVTGLSLLKSSRGQPPTVDNYPNARIVNKRADPNSDHVLYSTMDQIETVADFYVRRLGSSLESGCKRIYYDEPPSQEVGRSFYRCVVDTSLLEMQQTAQITISYKKDAGLTFIDITRSWGSGR